MKPFVIPRSLVLASVLAVSSLAAPAQAETTDCTRVRRPPTTIDSPGIYCLARSFSTTLASGAAILIDADDVVLDLNGHTLDNSAAGAGTLAVGIRSSGHANVTVKNGTVRGFFAGVQLVTSGAFGLVVEGIRADRNTATGIGVSGNGAVVRDNQVLATGGSTSPTGTRAFGIVLGSAGGVVTGNLVSGSTAAVGSYTYGIHASNSDGLVIEANQVTNEAAPAGVFSYGIIVPFSQNVQVVGNRVTNSAVGIAFSSSASGKYRDNLTTGISDTAYDVGDSTAIDAGNNQ